MPWDHTKGPLIDGIPEMVLIEIKGIGVYVSGDHPKTGFHNGRRNREARVCRDDDLISFRIKGPEPFEYEIQGRLSGGYREDMPYTKVVSQLLLTTFQRLVSIEKPQE